MPYQFTTPSELSKPILCMMTPLFSMRLVAVLFSVMTLGIVIIIGMFIDNVVTGLLAATLYLTNPAFLTCMVRAMGDPILIFFMTIHVFLSILIAMRFFKHTSVAVPILAILSGIVSGLAMSTKLNGALLLISFWLVIAVLYEKRIIADALQVIVALTISLVTTFYIFFFLNPYLWTSPLQNFNIMVDYRLKTIAYQSKLSSNPALSTISDRISHVIINILLPKGDYTTFHNSALPFDIVFFCFGLYILIRMAVRSRARGSMALLFLVWAFPIITITTTMLAIDWDRYYLPIILIIKIIQAVGITHFFSYIFRLLKPWRRV